MKRATHLIFIFAGILLACGPSSARAGQEIPPPTMSLDKGVLQFGATNSGTGFVQQTSAQNVRLTQTGAGMVTWTATPNQSWITVSPALGTGSAKLSIGVQFAGGLPVDGTSTGTVALVYTGAENASDLVGITLTTVPSGASAPPFGVLDTPLDRSTGVTGSIAVTGWALDDVEVMTVRILRDPVPGEGASPIFIGNAVLVDGSRSDVAGQNPSRPFNTRAGWGYLLLTNFLPNQGNGTFKLYAAADDAEGHSTALGSKTITCTNGTATAPFGAIDTPGQGEVVSGTGYSNFAWVLVRGPARANPPFGTVNVYIDSLQVGVPGGWTSRSDLTALFPAATYPGVTNALAVWTFDTTTLANGVHTISWLVFADNGQGDGVGSRFFTVANGAGFGQGHAPVPGRGSLTIAAGAPAAPLAPAVIETLPVDPGAITGRRGYDLSAPVRALEMADGRATLHGEELDRFEVHGELITEALTNAVLTGEAFEKVIHSYTGYLRTSDSLAALPVGSHLDETTGVFSWQPGVGFIGPYDVVFVRWLGGRPVARHDVRIVIHPKGSNRTGPQVVIDTPAQNADVAGSFTIGGWAIDLDNQAGTGIDALHVWAYPAGGGSWEGRDPIFVGAASYGGARPDVAGIYGERFRNSGYGIGVDALPAGTYDVAVFAWSTLQSRFVPAKVVRVTVR